MLFIDDRPFWHLSFLKYIFIIWLGYKITIDGIHVNWKTASISILSILATSLFCYVPSFKFATPYVFESIWKFCHWPCYYYIVYLCIPFFYIVYKKNLHSWITNYILKVGQYSYDLFLIQMFYFVAIHPLFLKSVCCYFNTNISQLILAPVDLIVCALCLMIVNKKRFIYL